jgi:hypothetical protein
MPPLYICLEARREELGDVKKQQLGLAFNDARISFSAEHRGGSTEEGRRHD